MDATVKLAEPELGADVAVEADLADSLRILTCGSVDDGKSTLIGRMLWDASELFDDQRATLAKTQVTTSAGTQPDFSSLVDGLAAEREQGITIDIAWRFFDMHNRRYIVIDSPGHEQYTRNMASGASHADVAIMLTDARHGVKRQTRRHAAILHLMGVKRVVLAVNKMDLADWSQERFDHIASEFAGLTARFGFEDAVAIPVCAVTGDNVALRSKPMAWYAGPTLVEHLEALPPRLFRTDGPFRMPVQMVLRDGKDFRGLAGTVRSGRVSVGDEIVDALSGNRAVVARIGTMDGDLAEAVRGQAVVIGLDRDLDISRGDVLTDAGAGRAGSVTSSLSANLVWLSETPYDSRAGYLLRTATDLVPIDRLQITALLDLETLAAQPSDYACAMNDIASAEIDLGRACAVDVFENVTGTGCFMIVDALTGASVAGGTISATKNGQIQVSDDDGDVFVLDRAMLAAGLCRDLGDDPAGREEFERRVREVTVLMKAAGIRVKVNL